MGAEGRTIVVLNAGSRNLRAVAFDWATLNEVGRDELRWDEGSGAAAQGHGEAAAALLARGAWPWLDEETEAFAPLG